MSSRSHLVGQRISEEECVKAITEEIRKVVELQEELDIDVLVHGEPQSGKRSALTSYGSRCVKPPIIYGDVSRPNPMTVFWSSKAQSLTKRPMKGILTGLVTILN
ncbi:hypothetical protein RIF29_40096 [Crotalaria pallida]|uniref:Cobalamin-independent methionine synthase MetE C-terminal/archaeal domain-containing protein n=1 Tax=Crotalaria pallida TaxID=3830 RepID=A0AAN9E2W5_CROPI